LRTTIFLLLAATALAQKNPHAGDKDAIEAGRGTFRIFCAPCHGINADGGRGPDLTLGQYSVGNDDAAVFRVISNGAQGTEMPGFGERLEADIIWRLVSYVRSVSNKPAPVMKGDRAAGEKLFWGKGACGGCHRIGQRGGRMGPDLSHVGRQRSLAFLKEAVVTPNAYLTPGNYAITVTLRGGKKVTGVQRGYDGFSAQFLDASDTFHSYFTSDVVSIERRFESLMPDNYGKVLRPPELDDLLVYMVSLGRSTGGRTGE